MQISTVNYLGLNHELRIDAEYYREEILHRLSILDRHNKDTLSNLASFVIGPFGSTVKVDQYVENSDFRYIRNKDINNFLIKDNDPALIPYEVFNALEKYHVKENDLLITVVGTLGKISIARQKDIKSIFSCKSTIIRTKKLNPFYLLAYLNTNTGKLFSLRGKRGAIQEGLNLSDLKEIQVFIPSNMFQNYIEVVMRRSFMCIDKSQEFFEQAKISLLFELGLTNWQPEHKLSFIKNYSDTEAAHRIDAEYFQPKYDRIIDAIKNCPNGCYTLGNLVTVSKCVEVGSSEYIEAGIPFVRVSNLSPFEITEDKYISEKLYSEISHHQPKRGEILLSKDATPGIAHYLSEEPKKMIPSGGILRLKSKSKKINNEYLTLVLNSILTKDQVKRDVGGSVILHWRPDQVKQTLIPILPEEQQALIKKNVVESFRLRSQSKFLLEFAKKAVEIAIEQDENIAQQWLEEQTKSVEEPKNIDASTYPKTT